MGGGGFTSEPDNPALDDFVLSLARAGAAHPLPAHRQRRPERADRAFQPDLRRSRLPAAPPLAVSPGARAGRPARADPRQDVVYVGGGSMRNLLAIWREHGLDPILREAWEGGVVLAGLSAGAMCWFEHGITRSAGRPQPTPALGFLPGSLSVHYDGDPSAGRPTSTPWRAARSPAATAPTTASACSSRAPSSCGSSPPDPARTPTAWSARSARARRPARDGARARAARCPPAPALARVPDDIREYRAERYGAAGRR